EAYQTLFSFFPDNLEYGLQLANAETAGGRGKDALKILAALDGLGEQTKENPRIDLARSDAAASLGDHKLRRDMAELAAQKAGQQGAKLLVARSRDSECRALADLGENEKAKSICGEARQIYEAAGVRFGREVVQPGTDPGSSHRQSEGSSERTDGPWLDFCQER